MAAYARQGTWQDWWHKVSSLGNIALICLLSSCNSLTGGESKVVPTPFFCSACIVDDSIPSDLSDAPQLKRHHRNPIAHEEGTIPHCTLGSVKAWHDLSTASPGLPLHTLQRLRRISLSVSCHGRKLLSLRNHPLPYP